MTDVTPRLAAALADRYRIERELGQGGMATVYLAHDLRHNRKVALKVMRPELAATMGSQRFLREVQTAAQLQHPHILPLHDSGETDGFLWFVMPYVEGESLRTRLARQGELPVGEAVRLLRDVADALAHAHTRGVVHRDIKPDNILLSGRHAMVTDFGVAKAVDEATGRNTLTTAGVALGTPTYMAPEQAAADPHVDHRADIYALGVVAYELLTGTPPFTGSSPQQVLAAHVTQAPKPVTEQRATVPPAVAATIMRCLAKKPADRWQSADELLQQLEGFATPTGGSTPVDTRPVTAVPAAAGRSGRRTWLAAGTVLGVLAVVGAVLAVRGGRGGPNGAPRVVVLPPRNLGPAEQAYIAEGIAEEINNRLVALPGLEVIGRSSAERYRASSLTSRQIGEELNADYILSLRVGSEGPAAGRRIRVSAELVRASTEAQVWSKSYQADAAADYFRVQGDIAGQVAQELGVALVPRDRERIARQPTDDEEAYDYYLRGAGILRTAHLTTEFRDAATYLQRAVDRDPGFDQAWASLAEAHTELYWFFGDRTERRLAMARQAAERARSLAPDAPETHYAWGVYYYHAHLDFPRALEHLENALHADPGRAQYREFIGYVQRRAGRFEDALASLERARQLDPRSVRVIRGIGESMLPLGRQDEAVPFLDRALELAPEDWIVFRAAIGAHVQRGDLPRAAGVVRAAFVRPGVARLVAERPQAVSDWAWLLKPDERAGLAAFPPLGPEMMDTAGYHQARGDVLHLIGRDARASYDSAAAAYERRLRVRPEEGWDHWGLSVAYAGLGRRDDAVREGRRAVELLGPRDSYEGPILHASLAEVYLLFGERDSAAAAIERFIRAMPGNRAVVRYHPRYAQLRQLASVRELLGS
jgi:serine/threonine-protein kinase